MYRFYLAAVDLLPGVLILAPVYYILNRIYFHSSRKSFFYLVIISVNENSSKWLCSCSLRKYENKVSKQLGTLM